MLIDSKQIVKEAYSNDKKYGVILYKEKNTPSRLSEWIKKQDVKLLTLDGSYGGVSGKAFVDLSTDVEAQDDWHIGKKYDAQSYVRVKTILYKDVDGNVAIRLSKDDETQNSYLVVSKHFIRKMNNNFFLRAKSPVIESMANAMVGTYINDFNAISGNKHYSVRFIKACEDGMNVFDSPRLWKEVNGMTFWQVMSQCKWTDIEFQDLVRQVLSTTE